MRPAFVLVALLVFCVALGVAAFRWFERFELESRMNGAEREASRLENVALAFCVGLGAFVLLGFGGAAALLLSDAA